MNKASNTRKKRQNKKPDSNQLAFKELEETAPPEESTKTLNGGSLTITKVFGIPTPKKVGLYITILSMVFSIFGFNLYNTQRAEKTVNVAEHIYYLASLPTPDLALTMCSVVGKHFNSLKPKLLTWVKRAGHFSLEVAVDFVKEETIEMLVKNYSLKELVRHLKIFS